MSTYLTATPAPPLTADAATYMSSKLRTVQDDLGTLRAERARLAAEVASMDVVIGDLEDTEARYQARLGSAVSLLPPLPDLADDPEDEPPLAVAAHQAIAERAGEHPYGPATVPYLPRFTDRVHVEGVFPSEPRREVAL